MVLETYSMIELLDEVQLVPKKFLKDLSDAVTTVLNPNCWMFFSLGRMESFGK